MSFLIKYENIRYQIILSRPLSFYLFPQDRERRSLELSTEIFTVIFSVTHLVGKV